MNDTSIYYNYDKLASYGAFISFIQGGRGIGKSYGAKKWVIRDYIKRGNQFVYIRRYKQELKTSVPHFFDDIAANNEFPDHEFKVKGNEFIMDDEVIGYAIPLTTANILKSTSYPNVKTIIFDEYQLAKGGSYRYLKGEVDSFLEVVETVGRMRDVRVWMLSNSLSTTNPYFLYWNLHIPHDSEFKLFKDGLILVNSISNKKFIEAKKKTRFGRLISGTKYGNYAIENEFLNDSKSFIRKKSGSCSLFFILVFKNVELGVWLGSDGYMYISKDFDPNCQMKIAVNADDHDEQTILQSKVSPFIKNIIRHYQDAKLCFETQDVKNIVMEYLVRCIHV